MASGVFNIARGRMRTCFELAPSGSAIVVALFKTMVTDDALKDLDTMAQIKAVASEADFTNYSRKIVTTGITINLDDANDQLTISMPNMTWTAAGGAANNDIVKLIVAYRPNAAAGDTSVLPLTYHDYITFTDGTNRTVNVNSSGLWRSYSPGLV